MVPARARTDHTYFAFWSAFFVRSRFARGHLVKKEALVVPGPLEYYFTPWPALLDVASTAEDAATTIDVVAAQLG